jgi:hypothetical protein
MWPLDRGVLEAWALHPWIIVLDRCSWDLAIWMGVLLGAVGLLRTGWLPKLMSGAGIGCSLYFWVPIMPGRIAMSLMEAIWNVFDVFREWVLFLSGGEPGAEATLWACILLVVWLVVRSPMKRAFQHVQRLQACAVRRWPELSKLLRPVF